MPSSLTAAGIVLALTPGGSWSASPQPDGDTNAAAAVDGSNSDGAYLVVAMALLGFVGLAGITRRDYIRAHRHSRGRGEPVVLAPRFTEAQTSPVERTRKR